YRAPPAFRRVAVLTLVRTHAVCKSGDEATRRRRAVSTSVGAAFRFSCAFANETSSVWVCGEIVGVPQKPIALWTSWFGSEGALVGAVVPWTRAAMNQRARHVAVSSQRV